VLVRRLTTVLAATVVAGFAASGCASQAVGVRVGGETYSQADLVQELDAYGENEKMFPPGEPQTDQIQGELAGSYSQSFVSEIVQQRINFMLAQEVFDDHHLQLTDDDREAAEAQLASQIPNQAFDQFPDDYREQLIDDVARLNLVVAEMGEEEFSSALLDTARSNEIEVGPRFGDWDEDQLQLVPPTGSTPAPGSGPDLGSPGAGATPSG
jgi:hypothetical protein